MARRALSVLALLGLLSIEAVVPAFAFIARGNHLLSGRRGVETGISRVRRRHLPALVPDFACRAVTLTRPRHDSPTLHVHQGSEPSSSTVKEETNPIMDIPTALITNHFPTPNSNSSLISAALAFTEGESVDKAIMAKWRNLVLLITAAVYATSILITVDMESWRGWTIQEIMLRIPYDNWQEYEGGLSTHPIFVKTVINVVIYVIGDWMSQVGWGRTKNLLDFDLARTARNGLIGAMFGPLVHYYYDWSDYILPMEVPVNRVLKLLMDQSVYFVAKCSAYIALVGLLRGDTPAVVAQDVKERIQPVVFRGWRFWPLAHVVTYGVIPPRHRVLWVNMLDLLWSSILASLASKEGEEDASTASSPVPETGAALMNSSDWRGPTKLEPAPPGASPSEFLFSTTEVRRAEEEEAVGRDLLAAATAVAPDVNEHTLHVLPDQMVETRDALRPHSDGESGGSDMAIDPARNKSNESVNEEDWAQL